VLCGGDAPVAEHFGDAFDGHTIDERYGGSEGVASDVESEFLIYVAVLGNLLQGAVGFLVARNGHFRLGRVGRSKVSVVFSNERQGNGKQWNVAGHTRFLAFGADPIAVILFHKVVWDYSVIHMGAPDTRT
jgi:hypothetical protein